MDAVVIGVAVDMRITETHHTAMLGVDRYGQRADQKKREQLQKLFLVHCDSSV